MSDIGSGIDGRIQPRPGGGQAPAPVGGGGRPKREGPGSAGGSVPDEPSVLEHAFQRLRTLLAFDGENGPRDGVRPRGFYLNILV